MPFANDAGARMLLDGAAVATHVSLHTGAAPTEANELLVAGAPGYARQALAGPGEDRWRVSAGGEAAGMLNDQKVSFLASGGDWPAFLCVALRDGTSGGAQISAYAALAQAVTLADGDEWSLDDGAVSLALTRAGAGAAGFVGRDTDMDALLDAAGRKGLASAATYLRLHSAYPTDANVIAAYPAQALGPGGVGWERAGNVVRNAASIRYAATLAQRAAPAWWSVSLDAAATMRLLVGQVAATQAAVAANVAFRIAPGQIAVTVEDA